MLSRTYRIQGEKNVARVYRQGQSARAGQLSLKFASNRLEHSRLAVVVSKKISKSAPVRNRIRRRLYERFRHHQPHIRPGYDLVLSVFADDLAAMKSAELDTLFRELLQRAKLWDAATSA